MAFWSRLKQSKPKFDLFTNELKRCYTRNHAPHIYNHHAASRSLIPAQNSANVGVHSNESLSFCQIRFYAAPVQVTQKKEEKSSKPKLNEQIATPFLRLITDEGHSVLSRNDALARAKSLKMDLVEVDKNAKPPVCKIMDYNKEKYLQKLKEKESKDRAKSKGIKQGAFKEIRFAAKIEQNDLQMKADMVKRLMESGHRVKCTAVEPTDALDLETLLSRFTALIEDVACLECAPKVEKKQAYVVARHVKFGTSKKGSGKKASKAAESTSSNGQSSKKQPLNESGDAMVANSQTLNEESSDEDIQARTSKWDVSNGDDDFNTAFDIEDEANESTYSKQGKTPFSADRSSSAASSTPNEVQTKHVAAVNRYARDPRSVNPSKVPTDMNERSARNRINASPQLKTPQRHEARNRINASPQLKTPQRHEVPARDIPGVSNHESNLNQTMRQNPQAEVPAYGVNGQDPSSRSSTHNSPTKSYGIFSAQVGTSPSGQAGPAESNRYKKIDPSESARSRSSTGYSPNRHATYPDEINNRRPSDNPERGRWGSNVIQNKNEGHAETQRR